MTDSSEKAEGFMRGEEGLKGLREKRGGERGRFRWKGHRKSKKTFLFLSIKKKKKIRRGKKHETWGNEGI